ncbi:hypothetical protein QCB52_16870, partial [Myroides odoratimimus]
LFFDTNVDKAIDEADM